MAKYAMRAVRLNSTWTLEWHPITNCANFHTKNWAGPRCAGSAKCGKLADKSYDVRDARAAKATFVLLSHFIAVCFDKTMAEIDLERESERAREGESESEHLIMSAVLFMCTKNYRLLWGLVFMTVVIA